MKKSDISWRVLFLIWFRWARKLFILTSLVVLGVGASIWYADVYRGEWTPEERRAYAEKTFSETVFNKTQFLKSVATAEKRSMLHADDIVVGRDFFVPLPGMEKH